MFTLGHVMFSLTYCFYILAMVMVNETMFSELFVLMFTLMFVTTSHSSHTLSSPTPLTLSYNHKKVTHMTLPQSLFLVLYTLLIAEKAVNQWFIDKIS